MQYSGAGRPTGSTAVGPHACQTDRQRQLVGGTCLLSKQRRGPTFSSALMVLVAHGLASFFAVFFFLSCFLIDLFDYIAITPKRKTPNFL